MDFREAAETLSRRGHKIFTVTGPKGFCILVDDTYSYMAEELAFLVEHGLAPGTRLWSRVILNSDVPEIQGGGMMNHLLSEYRKARLPEGVEVYRYPGAQVLYFSPEAAALLPDYVAMSPCTKPDTSKLRKQQL